MVESLLKKYARRERGNDRNEREREREVGWGWGNDMSQKIL